MSQGRLIVLKILTDRCHQGQCRWIAIIIFNIFWYDLYNILLNRSECDYLFMFAMHVLSGEHSIESESESGYRQMSRSIWRIRKQFQFLRRFIETALFSFLEDI